MFITYITSRIIWRNLAPSIQILAEQSFYGLLITRTGPKQTPQCYWISPRCFRKVRKLGVICLPLILTTEQSISFANPVTMRAKWTLLLKRDQIVQHQFTQPVDAHMKTTTRKSVLEIKLLYQDSWQALKVFGRHLYFSWDRRSVQQKKNIREELPSSSGWFWQVGSKIPLHCDCTWHMYLNLLAWME